MEQGLSLEEYILDLLSKDLDPLERSKEYIEAAMDFLNQGEKELERNNVRQAAEKLWGAVALAVKAFAAWRDKKRLSSHRELWEYSQILIMELGDWVSDAWAQATATHICFYEGWCSRGHVEQALKRIRKFVEVLALKISGERE